MGWSQILFSYFKMSGVPFKRVIDIGCGTGTLLHYLKTLEQSQILGFDTNYDFIKHGIDSHALELRCEIFQAKHLEAQSFNADLVTCIMVFEHLDDSAILAKEIAKYFITHDAKAYISVSFLKDLSHFDFNKSHYIFNDVGGHVTYFSYGGLTSLFNTYGLRAITTVNVSKMGWSGILFGSQ